MTGIVTACEICGVGACHECLGSRAVTCASCDGQGCRRCTWSGAIVCIVCCGTGACSPCLAASLPSDDA